MKRYSGTVVAYKIYKVIFSFFNQFLARTTCIVKYTYYNRIHVCVYTSLKHRLRFIDTSIETQSGVLPKARTLAESHVPALLHVLHVLWPTLYNIVEYVQVCFTCFFSSKM